MPQVFENTEIYTTEGASGVELVKSTLNTKKFFKSCPTISLSLPHLVSEKMF